MKQKREISTQRLDTLASMRAFYLSLSLAACVCECAHWWWKKKQANYNKVKNMQDKMATHKLKTQPLIKWSLKCIGTSNLCNLWANRHYYAEANAIFFPQKSSKHLMWQFTILSAFAYVCVIFTVVYETEAIFVTEENRFDWL